MKFPFVRQKFGTKSLSLGAATGLLLLGVSIAHAQFTVTVGGDDASDEAKSILPDGLGGAFVSGVFEDTVDFDPGSGVVELMHDGNTDNVFLARYDGSGDLVFAVEYGNEFPISAQGLTPDGAGGVFVVGTFRDTVDFDPGGSVAELVAGTGTSFYVARYTGSGQYVFARGFGGDGKVDTATDAEYDGSGGVWVTGDFSGTVDFDPSSSTANLTSGGNKDVFLARYDQSGNYVSAINFGGSLNDTGLALTPDANGGIYLGGRFIGTVDFDPGAGSSTRTSSGTADAFVARYDSNSNFVSVLSFGGVNGEVLNDVAADDSGGVFVTGGMWGSVDFDPTSGTDTRISNGNDDIYVARYDSNGSLVFANAFGTNQFSEQGHSVTSDGAGGVYVSGTFQESIDFDPASGTSLIVSNGSTDAFLAHYSGSGQYVGALGYGSFVGDGVPYVGYNGPEEIFLAGAYQSTVDFDFGTGADNRSTNGLFDIYVKRFSNVPAAVAESSMSVTGNGTVDFGSDVAICIDFEGVFQPGTVTIERFDVPVQGPFGVSEPVVYETHWRIVASLGLTFTAATVVRIKLDDLPPGVLPDPESIQFYKRSLYGAGELESVTTMYNATTNEIEITGFTTFSEFVAGGETPLPVELVGLTAYVDGNDVILDWETHSESDNAGFEVQRRSAEEWNELAFVEGRGTTVEPAAYSYRIVDLRPGAHEFRLKQIDFDGSFEYSPVVEATIELPGTHYLSEAYPNPFSGRSTFSLTVARDQEVRVELIDVAGRRVAELFQGLVSADHTHRLTIDADRLSTGVYFYRVVGDYFSESRTVAVLK